MQIWLTNFTSIIVSLIRGIKYDNPHMQRIRLAGSARHGDSFSDGWLFAGVLRNNSGDNLAIQKTLRLAWETTIEE